MSHNDFIGLSADDVHSLELLRTRITPMVYNLEQLFGEMIRTQEFPPNWTTLLRHTTNLQLQLKSFQEYLDSTHHQDDGQLPVTVADAVLATLHPYPVPPLPENGLGLIETLLRKKPQLEDETYIADRLASAAKFCRVPADQGIEPPSEDAIVVADEDDAYGGIKCVKTNLDEDEISEVWDSVGQSVVSMWQMFESAVKGAEYSEEPDPNQSNYADKMTRMEQDNATIEKIQGDLGMSDSSSEMSGASTPTKSAQQSQLAEKPARPIGSLLKYMSEG